MQTPVVPTGAIKTFGPLGPKYQVGNPVRQLEDGDWLIHVVLVETGEEADVRLSGVLDDPEAI